MENTSFSEASNGDAGATTSKRRIWSRFEEEKLVLCMKVIVGEGWKVQNGFRTGYQKAAWKLLKKEIPNTDLTSEHVKNKIHVWKKQCGSLQQMIDKSGFEWDDARKVMVFREESIWLDYVKTDPFAKPMKNKSFPFFKDWIDIFGKDKATGELGEDCAAAEETPLEEDGDTNENDIETDDHEVSNNDHEVSNAANIGGSSSGKKRKGKKRCNEETQGEEMTKLMGKFCDQTNENLQIIGKRIGYEVSLTEKRENLWSILYPLNKSLSDDQRIFAATKLINNNKDLELFFSLPDDMRALMVELIVKNQ